jgi:hypothetical protein
MSYILEALKKSDAERKRGEEASLDSTENGALPVSDVTRKPWAGRVAVGFALVAALGLGTAFLMKDKSAPVESEAAPSKPTVVQAPHVAAPPLDVVKV